MSSRRERVVGIIGSLGYYLLLGPVSLVALAQAGWPLPRGLSRDAVERALGDGVTVDPWKAVAFFGWVLWLCLAWSTGAMVWAWARRRTPTRVLLPASVQPLLFKLATGLLVIGSANTSGHSGPPRLAALVVSAAPDPSVVEVKLPSVHDDLTPPPAVTPVATATQGVEFDGSYLLVRRHNTLSGIAAGLLQTNEVGDDEVQGLVRELVDLNVDDVQADGQRLTDPDVIEVGWWLRLPSRFASEPGGFVMVEHGDSAWDIAEECLEGPHDRHELVALNLGRPQPDGRTLQDADYLRERWLLRVPDRFVRPPVEPRAAATGDPLRAEVASPPSTSATTATTSTEVQIEVSRPLPTGAAVEEDDEVLRPSRPVVVRLPSGSVVGASFVSGFALAVGLGRLRRRRRWQPIEPAPGLPTTALPRHGDSVHRLLSVDTSGEREQFEDNGRDEPPWLVEVGCRDDQPVSLDILGCGGVAIRGSGAEQVVRAIAVLVLTRGSDEECVLLTDAATAVATLGTTDVPGLRTVASEADVMSAAEAELAHRARTLERAEAESFADYRHSYPEASLPGLVILLDGTRCEVGRTRQVIREGRRVGVGVVLLGTFEDAAERATVSDDGRVTEATGRLNGVVAHRLVLSDAPSLVQVLRDARGDDEPLHRRVDASDRSAAEAAPRAGQPVRVQLFGTHAIEAGGQDVRTGLRSKARELLAFFILRSAGATNEEVFELLWPEANADQARDGFKKALGSLRKRLREATGDPTLDLVESVGDGRYRVQAEMLDVDVWRFEQALADAQRAADEAQMVEALTTALDAYDGELLRGAFYEWAEPVRTSLRDRALDTVARLAELHEAAHRLDDALAVLERGIELDPLAEELYARAIRLQCRRDRLDSAKRILHRLEASLASIGEEPLEATALPLVELSASKRRGGALSPAD